MTFMSGRARAVFLLAAVALAPPALAQDNAIDLRVGKLEKEVRAVQRVVFPQGTPVQPDIAAAPTTPVDTGTAATSPTADLIVRVDALERQVATLTGASEQNAYRLKQTEATLAAVEARLTKLEGGAPASSMTPLATESPRAASPVAAALTLDKPPPTSKSPAKPAPTKSNPAKSDPARKAAVAAIEMPETGDPAEDAYSYGFRLYTAKFYPEAQVTLKAYTDKYPPTSKRWSYAQNLLGRAYLEEGKPALASVAFYANYQKAPKGERAAESLTWLGQALIRLKKLPDACKVFVELNDVYGTRLTADQKSRAEQGRSDAKCATAG